MKKRQIIIALSYSVLSCVVMAADSMTNTALTTVATALQPVLTKLAPKPTMEFPEHTTSLIVTYLPQTYKIHPVRSKTGEFSTNVIDEVGPSFRGFVLRIHLQPKGAVIQASTPQTIREPYWQTDLDITTIGQTDKQVCWALSYAWHTSTNVLAELKTALKQLEKSPNQASEAIGAPSAPQPQR